MSIYALIEMNKRAEEYTLKVRSELFRIGCGPESIQVFRHGMYLKIIHKEQIVMISPQVILGALRKLPQTTEDTDIWKTICDSGALQIEQNFLLSRRWGLFFLVVFLLISIFIYFFII